ncbi:MAG: S9 family peptidase [Gemmatimonadetes bacterium]|nr:S9 family peptidase [Gemmatimonadota bacterium]
MRFRLVTSAALAAALPTLALAQGAGRPFTPADWYRVVTVSTPSLSPDGKLVAMTVTTPVEKDNKRHSEVWVVPTSGGAPARWTSPALESSAPRFSPDGKYLVFTSQRAGGKGNLWAIRLDQPGGEAFQPENALTRGSAPANKAFTVWADVGDDTAGGPKPDARFDRMQPMARPPYNAITRPLDPARFDGKHITEMRYQQNEQGFIPGPRVPRRWNATQVWMQKADGSPKAKLTSTAYSHRDVVVSPDGQWIAFVADAKLRSDSVVQAEQDSLGRLPYDAKRDEAPRNDVDIYVMPATGGEPRKVSAFIGAESQLAWSPDSKRIAFIAAPSRWTSTRLWVVEAAGGTPKNLIGTFQYEPQRIDWLTNETLAMSAEVGGSTGLFHVSAAGGTPKQVIGGRRRLSGFSYDEARSQVAYVSTSLARPTELYVANSDGSNERKLTAFNDALNAEIAWSDAERFTYRSVGNLEIEAWLMKPPGYDASRKYPVVLYIHGGPHSAYGENWFDEFQSLAASGVMVLFTNPRGSSGYGAAFTNAIRGRWFAEDYKDLMLAVDIAAKRPDVDSTKMGVTGGSYGGVMTAWITSHTNRFKAAENDRMISNWWSWYGTSDAQGLTEGEFYGKPWDNPAMYDSLSPIRYAPRVRTPTLMVQSEEDHRTPMTDADQWFMALKKHGVPVEWVRYPRSTHELSRSGEPWLLVDRLGRIRQWFGYWLLGKPVEGAPAGERAAGRSR